MKNDDLTEKLIKKINQLFDKGYDEKQVADKILYASSVTLDQLEEAATSLKVKKGSFMFHVGHRKSDFMGSLTGIRPETIDDVVALKNIDIVLRYSRKHWDISQSDIKKLSDVVVKFGDCDAIFEFSKIYSQASKEVKEALTNALVKRREKEPRESKFSSLHMPSHLYGAFVKSDFRNDDIMFIEHEDEKYYELFKLVPEIEEEIVMANNIFKFAKLPNHSQESLEKLADEIIKTGIPRFIVLFAKEVNVPSKVEDLAEAIIEIGDAQCIYEFMKSVPNAPMYDLVNGILQTVDKKCENKYSKKISEYEMETLNRVYQQQNAKYILMTANLFSMQPLEKYENAIIRSGSYEYMHKLAAEFPEADVKKIEDYIIENQNAEYMYLFASDIDKASKDRLLDALSKTRSSEYIGKAMNSIENAPLDNLSFAYVNLKKREYISNCLMGLWGIMDEDYINRFFDIIPEEIILLSVEEIVDYFINVFDIENKFNELNDVERRRLIKEWTDNGNFILIEKLVQEKALTRALKRHFPFRAK